MRRVPLLSVLVLLAGPSLAGDHRGHDDDLSQERKRGHVLPLAVIMERIGPTVSRNIVEIETERHEGAIIYEIYYLDGEGRRREIAVDARTGTILAPAGDD